VKISWTLPPDVDDIITGYRIFYGSRRSLHVPFYYVTSIVILENPPGVGQTVFIRSESTQLPSELINVTVIIAGRVWVIKSLYSTPSYDIVL
jgi:hypothetical protein